MSEFEAAKDELIRLRDELTRAQNAEPAPEPDPQPEQPPAGSQEA